MRVFAVALLVACHAPSDPLRVDVTVEVIDEAGRPIEGARLASDDGELATDTAGRVHIAPKTATLAVISKAGYLDEPVVVGRDDSLVHVQLWAAGPRRWAMHSAGDVMLGRRFVAPSAGEPLISPNHPADGARRVVAAIQPAFVAADVRTVNLETVVSTLDASAQYPGKRFILNTPPEALAALDALGVDAIDLANNHGRDYLADGIDATLSAIAHSSLPTFGESRTVADAPAPLVVHAGDVSIGMLGWTSVDGAFVNDAYPIDGAPLPDDVTGDNLWQYTPRIWGYQGASWSAPLAQHRIGSAWRLFADAEPQLSAEEATDAWRSLTAVYPELQDWVQRRGHTGAALWTKDSPGQIAALARTVDLVVVQIHAGFQFQSAPSGSLRMMARAAIDAGAGIVVCHHPHVVQGMEWYKGKLIVYSLGNFVFDQNFSTTFPSMFLRTIWDGSKLLEARLVPIELVGYRPMAAAGEAAARTLRRVWEMSVMNAVAERDSERAVRVFTSELDADTVPAQLRLERNTAVITHDASHAEERSLTVAAGQIEALAVRGLVDPRLGGTPDLEIGRELLGYGSFEDQFADGTDAAAPQWHADSGSEKAVFADDAYDGIAYLTLTRSSSQHEAVVSRPVARTTLVEHRLHIDRDGIAFPLDPPPRYTIRLRARVSGDAKASVRADLCHFDDTDPTEDPVSVKIGRIELPFDVPRDGQWHPVELPIDSGALVVLGLRANQLMPYLQLEPPKQGKARLDVDALEILEWRKADAMPDRFGAYDYVRNTGAQDRSFRVSIQP